jgi:hypothetical protein
VRSRNNDPWNGYLHTKPPGPDMLSVPTRPPHILVFADNRGWISPCLHPLLGFINRSYLVAGE